jgi:hypothetical protein
MTRSAKARSSICPAELLNDFPEKLPPTSQPETNPDRCRGGDNIGGSASILKNWPWLVKCFPWQAIPGDVRNA